MLSGLVESQSVMLATLNMFAAIAICFVLRRRDDLVRAQAAGTNRHQRRSLTGLMEKKMKIENILARKGEDVVTIDISLHLRSAAELMMRNHIAALIVTDGGEPVGLISEHDLVSALAGKGATCWRIPRSAR